MSENHRIRVAIDAMGGDYAPVSIVAGAVLAQRTFGDKVELTLVGNSDLINAELGNLKAADLPIRVCHCDQAIGMADEPAESVRKKPN